MTTSRQPPSRHLPVIRVFVSSTFSDLVAERNALAEDVWPELERYCRQRGFTFQAIDLRWGVPSEAGLDHRTMQICFEELRRAQEASPEPNFLILLGDKYGWRPLPETISEEEYARLREYARSPEEQRTLETWYRRDGNAIPPHHILRARTDSSDGRDSTRVPNAEGCLRDTDAWLAVQETLWTIVNRAYPVSLLAERFAKGTDDMPASVHFQGSATEQEIWHGALQVQNPCESVVAWFREIDRIGGDPDPSQLKRFFDLRPDQSPDTDAATALATLRRQVEEKLRPDPVLRARCRWARDADGAFTGEVTSDHLAPMCEAILARLRALILRQINDYWKADLSAEDATATAVQASQHAFDLELRDHQRFAQERGPVDGFVGRDEQVRTIREFLQASTNRPLVVHGPSGSGKTALLAYVSQQPFLPGENGGVSPLILTRFIGAHPESSTLRGMLTSLCRELRVHFPIAEPLPDTLQKLIEEFYLQLGHATAEQPIYVFLDALDQLEAADQARECFWQRSQILPQAGESPCHARIVASCLSPSPAFPLESAACVPFRNLKSRGLLEEEELGALGEAAASQLLRQWLAVRQRGLTEAQWQSVDATVSASSSCRHPLYLQVLHEQLSSRREFDEPTTLPASLPLLIQETLERLCQPNQHGPLPHIALGYLVSARYGLSEGELLEILFRDPEMRDQLEASGKAYGHRLPPEADRYPIAPWARLRSELRAYLSERAAPGTTVLHFYHRQVEQAVRTLFLADEATRAERRRLLVDYFDGRWDQPDAHALMELPDLLLALPDHRRLYDRLTNFAFPMRKAEVGLLETILDDYIRLRKEGSADLGAHLRTWKDFFREHGHLLRRGAADQTVHKVLLQLALEHADDSPVTIAAEAWLSAGRCNWLRLQRVPRPNHLTPNPCIAVLEGHMASVKGSLALLDGRIVSWSEDMFESRDTALRLWDTATGICRAVLVGHTGNVLGALRLPDGRILSWAEDTTLRVWDAATSVCHAVLAGHNGRVFSVLLLPNGRVLSWSKDKNDTSLRVWDTTKGAISAVLNGHGGSVRDVQQISEDRILSWSKDETVRLWDTSTGTCQAVLVGCVAESYKAPLLLLPDDQIVSWFGDRMEDKDATLRVWDAVTGDCRAVLGGHTGTVRGAQSLSDGRILSWSKDKTLRVWDVGSGHCRAVLEGHTKSVWGARSLPDSRIISWSEDKTLRVWDIATETCVAVMEGHTYSISGVQTLSAHRFLTWSNDKTLRVWDTDIGACVAVMEGHTGAISNVLTLPDGQILSWGVSVNEHMRRNDASHMFGEPQAFQGGDDGRIIRLWDASTGGCNAVLVGHADEVRGVMLLPEGRILSWSDDKTLRVWEATISVSASMSEKHTGLIVGVQSLPKGGILSWSADETLRIWDTETGVCKAVLEGHLGSVRGAQPLPEDRILSWSNDRTMRVWDAKTGACCAVMKGHAAVLRGVLPLPNGRILSWSEDGTLRGWDAATGIGQGAVLCSGVLMLSDGRILSWRETTLRVSDAMTGACHVILNGHKDFIVGAQSLPDGRILSWSADESLRVWNAETGDCRAVLEGHTGTVWGASSLPDGRILSWSSDKTLRLWDAVSGACYVVLEGHSDWILGALSLPNGRILAWSEDKTLRVWDAASGACLEVIPEGDPPAHCTDWFHYKQMVDQPKSVLGDWCGHDMQSKARLMHRLCFTALPAWQAETDCEARLLQPDGTLVVTQANGQVCILKLHHGNRRVTLAEAEEILRSGGAR